MYLSLSAPLVKDTSVVHFMTIKITFAIKSHVHILFLMFVIQSCKYLGRQLGSHWSK